MNRIQTIQRAASAMALAVSFAVVALSGCKKDKTEPDTQTTATQTTSAEPLRPPSIPAEPTTNGPSLARKVAEEHYDVDTHMETDQCAECHGGIVEQWESSAHGFASFSNPYYRVSFEQFTKDADDRKKAQHCAGCHDPTMLFDGSIAAREVDPKDRRAHAGVTCNTCHGIVEATTDGNGSYLLSTSTIPIPRDGMENYDEVLAKHRARVANPVLRTNELCVSCHKGFLTPETGHDVVVSGIDDFSPFRRSGYNGNPTTRIDTGVPEKNCVGCHMPRTGPDNLRSHHFAGGHSSLAKTIGSDDQLAAIEKMVKGAAVIDVGAVGIGEVKLGTDKPKALKKGDKIWADVVVYNESTGHTFPGGALDLRDTWIETTFIDANGNAIAAAGDEHATGDEDPTAVRLRALLATEMGSTVTGHRVHAFRTAIAKHAINPRDALVARYSVTVGEAVPALPITVKTTLHHRRLHKPMADAACADSKTERGKAFAEYTKKYTGFDVDPCRDQPIIDIGTATAQLGGDERSPELPTWQRQWRRGLGLLHNVQENLPEATEAFQAALADLPDDAPKVERARIQFSLGLVAARQGRTQDAMDWWDKAEKLVGEHAAIHFARGNAHQRTFHNEEATEWYQKAAKLVDDDRVWRQLAISAGSAGKPRVAYNAALAGLIHEPRDPHLLRSQMLALRKLEGVDEAWEKAASEAFSRYKRDEQAANIRDKCSAGDEECRQEREPMRTIELEMR